MKTKRDVLKIIARDGDCDILDCKSECPYSFSDKCLEMDLVKIGAMAILRMFPKKRIFDPSKILTCVTADQAKVGMKGYFADDLAELKIKFNHNAFCELSIIHGERYTHRFENKIGNYALFYPIAEELAE